MHGQLSGRGEREDGAVAIIVAVCLTALLVGVAMVLDFGLVRIDRQVDKSAADASSLAGAHGLDAGDGSPHAFMGVCTALRYLKQNDSRFSSLPEGSGWTNGNGASTASGCTDSALRAKSCDATDLTTWAKYAWSGTVGGLGLTVNIQSGYVITPGRWSEDSLQPSTADQDDSASGCDQLAVIVQQSRKPGVGTLATTSDLTTAVRSVARVKAVPGGDAPAMLLLKQTGCDVLSAGAAAGGSTVHVVGAISNNVPPRSQAGTIHSDSDGQGCANNQNIFTGQSNNGIVAYAAPMIGNTSQPDPTKPGQISAWAVQNGVSGTTVRDSNSRVCGSTGLASSGSCPGVDVLGRVQMYRKIVDGRYLSAVTGAVADASSSISAAPGYSQLANCNPSQADINALNLNSGSFLEVTCPTGNGIFSNSSDVSIPAGTIVFGGAINPSAKLSLPNATHVYIVGSSSAALKLTGGTFSMHTSAPDGTSNLASGKCSPSPTGGTDKAVLVIANGDVTQSNGGKVQLCYTTLIMMGGRSDACLPSDATSTAPPNPTTPCGGGSGTGQLTQTGGDVDWTAPNRYDVMTLSDGKPDPARAPEWTDRNGPEDLAFWSESGGTASNPKYQMTGGGTVNLVGVLMTPNAQPFNLSGQFSQTLTNAQYIASSILLSSNNTSITMGVDPNSAVTVPALEVVGLVR